MEEQFPTQQPVITSASGSTFPVKKLLLALGIIVLLLLTGIFIFLLLKAKRQSAISTRTTQVATPTIVPMQSFKEQDFFEGGFLSVIWDLNRLAGNPEVKLEQGKLVMAVPGGGPTRSVAILTLGRLVTTYFETSVDVELKDGGEGSETAFVFHDEVDGWPNRLAFYLTKNEEGTFVRAVSFVDGEERELATTNLPPDNKVTFTITRATDSASFSIDGIPFAHGEGIYSGEGKVSLALNSIEPFFPQATSLFDNFTFR
jgi:hypothetical protein